MATLGFEVKADGSALDALRDKADGVFSALGAGASVGISAKIAESIRGSLGDFVNQAREVENLGVALNTLTGSAENTKRVLEDLKRFAATTPLTLDELAGASRMLLTIGVETKDLTSELKALANVASLANVPLKDMAYLYQRAGSRGKADAQLLNQIAQRGIPIINALAERLGVTRAEVYKLTSEGKVGFAEIRGALHDLGGETGKYNRQLEQMAKTGAGLQSTLGDNIDSIKRSVGGGLDDVVGKPAIRSGIFYLDTIMPVVEKLRGAIAKVIVGLVTLASLRWGTRLIADAQTFYTGMRAAAQAATGVKTAAAGATKSLQAMNAAGVSGGGFLRRQLTGMAALQMGLAGLSIGVVTLVDKLEQLAAGQEKALESNDLASRWAQYGHEIRTGMGNIGDATEQTEKLEEIDQALKNIRKTYADMKDAPDLLGWKKEDKEQALSILQSNIKIIENTRRAVTELGEKDFERTRLLRNEAEAERELYEMTQKKAAEVRKLREEYEKAAEKQRLDMELSGPLQNREDILRRRIRDLLSEYETRQELEEAARRLSTEKGSEEANAAGAALYERARKLLDYEKQLAENLEKQSEERDEQKKKLQEIISDYLETVEIATAELNQQWELVEALKLKNFEQKEYNRLLEAGVEQERAQRLARDMSQSRFDLEQERKARSLEKEVLDLLRSEKASKTPHGQVALEVLRRAESLMERYGSLGLSEDMATSLAIRERQANQMSDTQLLAGAVSSLASIGGGGGVESVNLVRSAETTNNLLRETVSELRNIDRTLRLDSGGL